MGAAKQREDYPIMRTKSPGLMVLFSGIEHLWFPRLQALKGRA